jgi:hypothetical protein
MGILIIDKQRVTGPRLGPLVLSLSLSLSVSLCLYLSLALSLSLSLSVRVSVGGENFPEKKGL